MVNNYMSNKKNSNDQDCIKIEPINDSERKITTVEEYLNAIDNIYKKFWGENQSAERIKYTPKIWYRGVKRQSYEMVPSISRDGFNMDYEQMLLLKFKSKAIPYLGQLPSYPFSEGVSSYWDWMFLMQHYGVRTRLMDWSEDALVALVFATSELLKEERTEDSAVWCLNPIKLNKAFNFNDQYPPGYIPNVEEKEVYEMFGPEHRGFNNKKPCAVYGPLNNTRIVAQKGVFTVFPYTKNIINFDELPDKSDYLEKLIISKESKDDIVNQLGKYGINYGQLFPEIGYVNKEISAEIKASKKDN